MEYLTTTWEVRLLTFYFIFPLFFSEDTTDESRRDQEKLDLVELLEAVTYLVCQDNHVTPDTFYKVSQIIGHIQIM